MTWKEFKDYIDKEMKNIELDENCKLGKIQIPQIDSNELKEFIRIEISNNLMEIWF